MTFVIANGCCKDGSCIPVCPVQCIRPRPGDPEFTTAEQLYVDPDTCIDCGACMDECPVDAVHPEWELPPELEDFLGLNAEHFRTNPISGWTPVDPVVHRLPESHSELSVAVVGSGPAACYAAEELAAMRGVRVSLLDRLPTPYGLVRAGVAPDHPGTKKIVDRFAEVIAHPSVSCFFGVEVGRDVTIAELLEHHHAVLWAGGADDDRRLGVPGEDLDGVWSAREFVAWYNGHPDHTGRSFDLAGRRAVVIGNGNVALDVARLLARPAGDLSGTDIADHALEALAASGVEEVVVTGRRGPEHAACSTGELIALSRTDGVTLRTSAGELEGLNGPDARTAVLRAAASQEPADGRVVRLRFGLTPVAIEGADGVEAVVFRRPDGTEERIEAGLVLRAAGYRGRAVEGLPFDEVTGTLPHTQGAVHDPATGLPVPGVYCAGWIKRGATGTIGTNRTDAAETLASLFTDVAAGRLPDPASDLASFADLVRGRRPDYVDEPAWRRIDEEEVAAGAAQGRPRRKLVDLDAFRAAATAGA